MNKRPRGNWTCDLGPVSTMCCHSVLLAISQNQKQQNQKGSPRNKPETLSGAHYPLSKNKRLGKYCDNGQRPPTGQGKVGAPRPIKSVTIKSSVECHAPPILKSGLSTSDKGILQFLLQFTGHHGLSAGTKGFLTNHSVLTEASPWGSGKDRPGHLCSPFLHPTPSPFPQTQCGWQT